MFFYLRDDYSNDILSYIQVDANFLLLNLRYATGKKMQAQRDI